MRLHWMDLAVGSALMGAGFVAIYAGLARMLRGALALRQRETDRQLSALNTTVNALQARVAELGRLERGRADEAEGTAANAMENESTVTNEPLRPEIVAALSAATTAILGKNARIRSAQPLARSPQGAGTWAQQGRVSVQTSHSPRSRR